MLLGRKQLGRMRAIGSILVRNGWGHFIHRFGLTELLHHKAALEAKGASEGPVRLVQTIEELGPTFIKFGQLLSTRSDLLPPEYIAELSKLQDTAPRIPLDQVTTVILEELGRPESEVFASFIAEPMAAASLGQVHAARLIDGSEVIVKVQRPGIRGAIETDLEIMYFLARFLENRWDRARTYGLVDVVDEFAIMIREELDYRREGYNTERIKRNLAAEDGIRVPSVYWELTTTRVLTLERLDGVKITDLASLDGMEVDRRALANKLSAAFFKQLLVDGFFHADPHPGNILVTAQHEIGLIDAGEVRQLDVGARNGLIRLIIAFEHRNTRQFADEVVSLGIARAEVDVAELTRDLEKLLRQYYDLPARATNVGLILMGVMKTSAHHRIRLPTGFTVVGKVLADIDGINRQLDPDWNFTAAIRPYVSRAVKNQMSYEEVSLDAYRAVMDLRAFIFNLPEYLNSIFRKAMEGTLRVEFRHRGLEELESRLDRITNRIVFAMIASAIIIGSSITVVALKGSTNLFGLPILAVAGYLIAMVLGLSLLISIIRSGRL